MPKAALPDVSAGVSGDRFGSVSQATLEKLERFVQLLKAWQAAHNLVSPLTLRDVWTRHVGDSLQLLDHAPEFRKWVDLGSGAGFPGLVVAIAAEDHGRVTLVEANLKKAAFLRTAIRETGAGADVAAERIEAHAPKMAGQADIVSARALAPLPRLCELAAPYLHDQSVLLLLKGQDFVREIEEASKAWRFDVIDSPSATDSEGRVLAIRNLKPNSRRA